MGESPLGAFPLRLAPSAQSTSPSCCATGGGKRKEESGAAFLPRPKAGEGGSLASASETEGEAADGVFGDGDGAVRLNPGRRLPPPSFGSAECHLPQLLRNRGRKEALTHFPG